MMKILYLADGSSIHTYKYISFFVDKGHEITLFSMRPVSNNIRKLNIKIIENKFVPKNNFLWLLYYIFCHFKYFFKIKHLDVDFIHAHDIYLYGFFALFSGKKYVLTPWGTDILIMPKKNKIYSLFLPLIFKKAKYIIYDGKNILDKIIKYTDETEKIINIKFGIDTTFFTPNKKKDTLNKKYNLKKLIISTRNLEPIYNVETLIKAAKLVLKKRNDVHFLIFGDGNLKNNLIKLVKSLSIESNISFMGKKSVIELAQFLSDSDIYVSTSLSDGGLSCSTAEAMSSGLPVIITNQGDNPNWIFKNKNGLLFEKRDFKDLSKKISYLLNNSKKCNDFGKFNSHFIKQNYDYYTEMNKISKLYNSV